MGPSARSETVAKRNSKSFDIWWDRNKKFLFKTSYELKRDYTDIPRIPWGEKNSGQMI
jgi:hypothetical protein